MSSFFLKGAFDFKVSGCTLKAEKTQCSTREPWNFHLQTLWFLVYSSIIITSGLADRVLADILNVCMHIRIPMKSQIDEMWCGA